ncbi:MAG: hypothetical protein HETSPECPRED_007312 [Heterodermia speciosa]|uniref:Uncharacterized protein n=1 Tax=Heterodermia speciosa TaxID=116794 RepID=A0A8H3IIG6_9LECA|nr:MAG: hypothetical protein HETSPECPRED_007312 [Heterodermia speciosa]
MPTVRRWWRWVGGKRRQYRSIDYARGEIPASSIPELFRARGLPLVHHETPEEKFNREAIEDLERAEWEMGKRVEEWVAWEGPRGESEDDDDDDDDDDDKDKGGTKKRKRVVVDTTDEEDDVVEKRQRPIESLDLFL